MTRQPTHSPSTKSNPARRGKLARLLLAGGLCLGVSAAGLLAGCGTVLPTYESKRGDLPVGSFKASWSIDIDVTRGGMPRALYLRDDLLIAYTEENVVHSISSEGGTTQFISGGVVDENETLRAPVVLDALGRLGKVERVLVFPSSKSFVIFTEDGTPVRRTEANFGLTSGTTGTSGIVYVGAADEYGGRILKIDPVKQFGSELDSVQLDGVINAKPVVFQRSIYAADADGKVYGITENLTQLWDNKFFKTERDITADLSVDDFGVYVAGQDGVLYVLDRQRGKLKWRYFAEVALFKRPIATDRLVFQSTGNKVVALSKTEGASVSREPLWIAEGATDFLSHDRQRVYLLHGSGHIVAHDKATGEELFRSDRNDYTAFARNENGARIFAATSDGRILAIDPVTTRGNVGEFAMAQ